MNTAQQVNYQFYLTAELEAYEGEWVVIAEGKIVAHGENAKLVMVEAREKVPERRLLLVKVPSKETMIY